ncbi:SRPBCC family protein [Chryseobacterium arthrosphaerae]|uniref:SRPBCC family protein n=1 Tax=Chryseobacterium arthrosphaerae TaxID=651561 RepID=UPI00241CF45E|nr:SRPBCC domain-containing protein [Chryseobacterium arthrosphaerae]
MKTIHNTDIENYTLSVEIKTTADKAFDALIRQIPLWWTEMFEGSSAKTDDIFTIRFGDSIYKTMEVKELIPDSRVVWYVKDSLIALPELSDQTEWIGTTIVWEIGQKENFTQLKVTHVGLHPAVECYTICSAGWLQFVNSLSVFLETGKGNPYKA